MRRFSGEELKSLALELPEDVLKYKDFGDLEKAKELGSELIVMGLPVNMDGSQGERAQKCREFGAIIADITGLEVVFRDERVTTVQAIGILNEANVRGKKRKAVIDTVAATLILEEYLEYRKKHR